MTVATIRKNKKLIKAFQEYYKRYLSLGKKPDIKKLFAEDLYSTTRLEGEKITKKEARGFFK